MKCSLEITAVPAIPDGFKEDTFYPTNQSERVGAPEYLFFQRVTSYIFQVIGSAEVEGELRVSNHSGPFLKLDTEKCLTTIRKAVVRNGSKVSILFTTWKHAVTGDFLQELPLPLVTMEVDEHGNITYPFEIFSHSIEREVHVGDDLWVVIQSMLNEYRG